MRFMLPPLALLIASCAPATSGIEVSDAWARATAPGQSSAAVYATIANHGGADQLIGVSAEAGTATLHRSDHGGGIARMRPLAALAIPAGATVALAPGGPHVMLAGLAGPLESGGELTVTLRFAEAGPRTVKVAVVAAGAR